MENFTKVFLGDRDNQDSREDIGDWDLELELKDELREIEHEHSERKEVEINLQEKFEVEF